MIDVSNGMIQFYMCERCESLLWLLNKIYLQIIYVITELEKMLLVVSTQIVSWLCKIAKIENAYTLVACTTFRAT